MRININMQHKGYTIIELLIALALFSIFLSIAVPKVSMFNRIKEQQELREFKKDILYARNKAIVEGKRYTVYLNYENNSYDISYNISQNKSERLKEYKFQYGLKLIRNPDLTKFSFTRFGTPGNASSIYLVDSKNNLYKLSVAPTTGKVSLIKHK